MTVRLAILALVLAASVPAGAVSVPPELSGRVAAARPAGCADYRFLFFRLYRAELWTDAAAAPGEEFGLSLIYHRSFSRDELVSSSISEMARMSGRPEASFATARAALERAMQGVAEGDRYTAWRDGTGRVEFFLNGKSTGALTPDADLFLDIWLGPASRDQERRATLLTGRCDD